MFVATTKISALDYLRYGVSCGAGLSKTTAFTLVDLVNDVADMALKMASLTNYLPSNSPLFFIATPLKDLKLTTRALLTFRPADSIFKNQAFVDKKRTVLTLSSLSLAFFNTLAILNRLKVDVSFIVKTFSKIPLFGRLPYGGLVNLANLALKSASLAMAFEAREIVSESKRFEVNLKIFTTTVKIIGIVATTLLVLTSVPTGVIFGVSCAFGLFDFADELMGLWLKHRPQPIHIPQ